MFPDWYYLLENQYLFADTPERCLENSEERFG